MPIEVGHNPRMSNIAYYFIIKQANSALEFIRPLVAQILEIRRSILARQPQVWMVLQKAMGNSSNREASLIMAEELEQLQTLAQGIQPTGAILKDINLGLVDFSALRDGRQVYLCWPVGEESVQHWHDIDATYPSHQKI